MLSCSAAKSLRFFLNDHLAEVDLVLAALEVRSALRDQSKHAKLSKCLSYSCPSPDSTYAKQSFHNMESICLSFSASTITSDINHDHYDDRHDNHYDDYQALPSLESLLLLGSCNRVQTQVTR